jgi:hypothetical protein
MFMGSPTGAWRSKRGQRESGPGRHRWSGTKTATGLSGRASKDVFSEFEAVKLALLVLRSVQAQAASQANSEAGVIFRLLTAVGGLLRAIPFLANAYGFLSSADSLWYCILSDLA